MSARWRKETRLRVLSGELTRLVLYDIFSSKILTIREITLILLKIRFLHYRNYINIKHEPPTSNN